MSVVTQAQPDGTPTWIDLGIPDLNRAMEFYGALFGWEFDVGPPETGYYTTCLLRGKRVAAILPNTDPDATEFWWNVHLATSDCDATVHRVTAAGGSILVEPSDVLDLGRFAIARDTVGAQFGLWQAREHIGCEIVNEPNSLVRNDLVTSELSRAGEFYATVFDYTIERNEDLPDVGAMFLRRPDGHEVGGIVGSPEVPSSAWETCFEVTDTDEAVKRAQANGGQPGRAEDFVYGRTAIITDPFGAMFSVISRHA